MRLLRNLTLHCQGAQELALAADAGFELEVEPCGVEVPQGPDGLHAAAVLLSELLTQCAAGGVAALIGGYTPLWIVALEILYSRGVHRPGLYYFETARRRDAEGRFVFMPERMVKVPEAFIRLIP